MERALVELSAGDEWTTVMGRCVMRWVLKSANLSPVLTAGEGKRDEMEGGKEVMVGGRGVI